MATPGIQKVIEGYDKLKTAVQNKKLREHVKQERAYAAGSAVLGALLAGAADAKYKNPDGSPRTIGPIPAVGGVSIALAALGITDLIPYGVYLGMAGVGGLCYVAGKFSYDHVTANAQQSQQQPGT